MTGIHLRGTILSHCRKETSYSDQSRDYST